VVTEVTVRDGSVHCFDEAAVLIRRNGRHRPVTRRATLGLLVNRVKRMRIFSVMTIKIVCGETVYSKDDIARLVETDAYKEWLSNPRRPLCLEARRRPMPSRLR
jgi:hypothetical protein